MDSSADLPGVLRRLLAHNWALGDRNVTPKVGVSEGVLALLYGLQAHAYSLAEATVDLWGRPGLRVAALPLTRAIFEAGITAQWVAQDPEAGVAVVAAYAEHRRKLANNLQKITGPFADAAPEIRAAIPAVTSTKMGTAQKTVTIAAQFDNGDELYAYYRILCGQTHAGVEVADKWLSMDAHGVVSFLPEPNIRSAQEEFLAIYGLLLAASAFEESVQTKGPDVTAFLDDIAREVGLPNTLILKSDGHAGDPPAIPPQASRRQRRRQRHGR